MESLPLTLFDIFVLVVVAISLVVAFMRGFVTEVLSLFAWGGAFFATLYGFPLGRAFTRSHIKPDALADTLLFLTLAIVSLILFKLAAGFIGDRVKSSRIGALDRVLGILFGLFRGLLVVCIAYMVISWIIPRHKQPDWIGQARSRSLIEHGSSFLRSLLPAEFAAHIAPFGNNEEIKDILKDMKHNTPAGSADKTGVKGQGHDKKPPENSGRLIKKN